MAKPSKKEFGKRRPAPVAPPSGPPVKRSGHVALLVMGTIAVGTTALHADAAAALRALARSRAGPDDHDVQQ
ncbi:hypothetical protein ACVWZ3_000662 [Bradyrhizobium sp. i1.3.6]